ncbi:hypothetical protein AB2M62_13770 [Sphingomonas sp. MMS12-HWE2-04]|uniref:hypothetical protein n=1 Tax=Sphingomonas sp. MMS12-HWE2-04 TaxID=3234199 RepID=UPI00384FEF36
MRVAVLGVMLALAACGGKRVAVEAKFDVDAVRGVAVTCIKSSGSACEVAFSGTLPMRGSVKPGETQRFDRVAAGTPMCLAADSMALNGCKPRPLQAGSATIAMSSYTS